MCLYLKNKSVTSKIATEDIPCVKVLNRQLNYCGYYSPYMGMIYKFNKVYKSDLKKTFYRGVESSIHNVVEEGLHSYKTKEAASKVWNLDFETKVFNAIIPKGAEYYENDTEYASSQLKVLSKETWLTRIVNFLFK